MKAFLRSGPVQGFFSILLSVYMTLIVRTIRWDRINEDAVKAAVAEDQPVIVCFWHGKIALAIAAKTLVTRRPTRILISLSPDGEFVARAVARHGLPSIRGSSSKKQTTGEKAKGGAAAAREAMAWLDGRGVLVITPDGPRGPAETMASGAVRMARRSGAPVFFIGLAARPAKRLQSWDRMVLPRPFGKGVMVWDGPRYAPAGADLDALAQQWSQELTAADARAEAALA